MLVFGLQGGGLFIFEGRANLTNSNLSANNASVVRARLYVTIQRTLELTGCFALVIRVADSTLIMGI